MKIKKLGLGALASGSIAAAAFALVASPAAADVNNVLITDDTIQIGQSVDVEIDVVNVMEGENVEITYANQGGEVTFYGDSSVTCELESVSYGPDTVVGTDDTATFDCDGTDVKLDQADGDTLTVNGTEDGLTSATFAVKATGVDSGDVQIFAEHNGVDDDDWATVLASSVASETEELEVSGPTSANPGDEVTITVTALDDEGEPVDDQDIEVAVRSGDVPASLDGTVVETNNKGQAKFTFVIDDSEDTGVSLTFFTPPFDLNSITVNHTIVIAGDADSVEVTAEESVATNSTSDVSATVLDEDGNPVPDAAIDFIVSSGNIVACDEETDGNGVAECTLVAPSAAGTVQITAVAAGAAGTATVQVTQGTGEGGDGSLTTPNFGSGNVGSAVFAGGSIEQLATAVQAAGGTGVWVQSDDGNWYRYTVGATGSTAFVNNAFNAEFAGGFPGATAVIVVK